MTAAPGATLLLEPQGRNTAPAIALAALQCIQQLGGDMVMLVLPADHLIPDVDAFAASAGPAFDLAAQGSLVVFGISPTTPDTHVDYVEVAQVSREAQPATGFVQKLDLATAQACLATGRHYWNSGIFCFTADAIVAAFEQHAPAVLAAARQALGSSRTAGDAIEFDAATFGLQPDVGLDEAVIAKANNVQLVPASFGWSDVGSWPAVANAHASDASGNTLLADAISIDTHGHARPHRKPRPEAGGHRRHPRPRDRRHARRAAGRPQGQRPEGAGRGAGPAGALRTKWSTCRRPCIAPGAPMPR